MAPSVVYMAADTRKEREVRFSFQPLSAYTI